MKMLDKFIINVRKGDLTQIGATHVYQLYINIPELRNYKELKASIANFTAFKVALDTTPEEYILNSDTFNFINNYSTLNMLTTGVLSSNSTELISTYNQISNTYNDGDVYYPIIKNINGIHRFWISDSDRDIVNIHHWNFKLVIVGERDDLKF
jgi:hypothetical protein